MSLYAEGSVLSNCTSYPPGTENCFDGLDNDGDGLVDCDDPDCLGDPTCPCVPSSTDEVGLCNDGIDNECDGLVDYEDVLDCPVGVCIDYLIKQSCNNDPSCEWNLQQGICQEIGQTTDCSAFSDQTNCEAAGCNWNNKKQQCR